MKMDKRFDRITPDAICNILFSSDMIKFFSFIFFFIFKNLTIKNEGLKKDYLSRIP
jgi:hypothetical protein